MTSLATIATNCGLKHVDQRQPGSSTNFDAFITQFKTSNGL